MSDIPGIQPAGTPMHGGEDGTRDSGVVRRPPRSGGTPVLYHGGDILHILFTVSLNYHLNFS